MALELRFYNGRQLSEHEQQVIARYQAFLATTKLGHTAPAVKKSAAGGQGSGGVKKPAKVKRVGA